MGGTCFSLDANAEAQLVEICQMIGVGNKSYVVRRAIAHYYSTKAHEIQTERAATAISNYAKQVREGVAA